MKMTVTQQISIVRNGTGIDHRPCSTSNQSVRPKP